MSYLTPSLTRSACGMDGIMNVGTTRHGNHSDIMVHNRGTPQLRMRKGFQETEGIELRARLEEKIVSSLLIQLAMQ